MVALPPEGIAMGPLVLRPNTPLSYSSTGWAVISVLDITLWTILTKLVDNAINLGLTNLKLT